MSTQNQEHETSLQSYLVKDCIVNGHSMYSNSYCRPSRQRMHSFSTRAGHVKNVQRMWQSSACSHTVERYNRAANIHLNCAPEFI